MRRYVQPAHLRARTQHAYVAAPPHRSAWQRTHRRLADRKSATGERPQSFSSKENGQERQEDVSQDLTGRQDPRPQGTSGTKPVSEGTVKAQSAASARDAPAETLSERQGYRSAKAGGSSKQRKPEGLGNKNRLPARQPQLPPGQHTPAADWVSAEDGPDIAGMSSKGGSTRQKCPQLLLVLRLCSHTYFWFVTGSLIMGAFVMGALFLTTVLFKALGKRYLAQLDSAHCFWTTML